MDKQYFQAFRKKMFWLQLAVSVLCVIMAISLLFFMDRFFNGVIIDLVEDTLGRDTAVWVMHHETWFIVAFVCLIVFDSFFTLEHYFIHKMDRIFSNINILFQKNNRYLELDEEFALLEEDLNELKRENNRREQMVELETKRKLDIITYLAHDIRTPLSSVIGYLCLLDEAENLPPEIQKKYISLTLEKAYRLETLVSEFFDITRMNMGKIPLERERVNLGCMAGQLADEFYPMASAGGRSVSVNVPSGLQIYADPDKIARVFNNILKNALAYSDENSDIVIEAQKKQARKEEWKTPRNGVEICIRNSGREIPQSELDKIFEQFYRLDQSRGSDTGGSGLGLAIAREIVTEHGGMITAESHDHMTAFRVWLPE